MFRLAFLIVFGVLIARAGFSADSVKVRKNIFKINPTSLLLPLYTPELSYERIVGKHFGIELGLGYVPYQYTTKVSNIPRTSEGYKFLISPKIYLHSVDKIRTYVSPMFTYHYLVRTGFIYGIGGLSYESSDYYQMPEVEYNVYEFAVKGGAIGTARVIVDLYLGLGFTSIKETPHVTKAFPEQPVFSPPKDPLIQLPQLHRFPYKFGFWLGYTF